MKVLFFIFGFVAPTTTLQPFHLVLIPYQIYQSTLTLLEEINSDKLVFFDYKQLKMKNISTEKLKEQCVKNKGANEWREFEENVLNFKICLNDSLNSWLFCENYQPNLHTCLKTYSKKLSICEKDENKELFFLHINSTTKMADYICNTHPYLQYPRVLENTNADCLLEFANYMVKRDVKDKLKDVRGCMEEKQASKAEKDPVKGYCKSQLLLKECVLQKVNIYCGVLSPVQHIVEDVFSNATFSLCKNKYNFTLS